MGAQRMSQQQMHFDTIQKNKNISHILNCTLPNSGSSSATLRMSNHTGQSNLHDGSLPGNMIRMSQSFNQSGMSVMMNQVMNQPTEMLMNQRGGSGAIMNSNMMNQVLMNSGSNHGVGVSNHMGVNMAAGGMNVPGGMNCLRNSTSQRMPSNMYRVPANLLNRPQQDSGPPLSYYQTGPMMPPSGQMKGIGDMRYSGMNGLCRLPDGYHSVESAPGGFNRPCSDGPMSGNCPDSYGGGVVLNGLRHTMNNVAMSSMQTSQGLLHQAASSSASISLTLSVPNSGLNSGSNPGFSSVPNPGLSCRTSTGLSSGPGLSSVPQHILNGPGRCLPVSGQAAYSHTDGVVVSDTSCYQSISVKAEPQERSFPSLETLDKSTLNHDSSTLQTSSVNILKFIIH